MNMHRRKLDLAARIEQRATTPWTDNDCWLSDRSTNYGGYIQIAITHDSVTTRRGQHAVAWEMHNAEPVPDGMVVMHTCDNPGCFNPNHLRLGTQSENIRDSVDKGRHACLIEHAAPLHFGIRFLHNLGLMQKDIADILACSRTTVCVYLKSLN